MRNLGYVGKVAIFGILLIAIASTCGATAIPVRGASGYGSDLGAPSPSNLGPDFGFSSCESAIINFLNTGQANNCEGYVTGTFTIGGSSFAGDQFAFLESEGTGFGILDVLQIAGNSSLTLSLLNPALPSGLFMCGSFGQDSTGAQDSQTNQLTGLDCTSGSSGVFPSTQQDPFAGTQDGGNVQVLFSIGGVTFINTGADAVAIFTQDGNIVGSTFTPGTPGPTTAPEPSSLILLGAGLVGVLGGRKRLLAR